MSVLLLVVVKSLFAGVLYCDLMNWLSNRLIVLLGVMLTLMWMFAAKFVDYKHVAIETEH